MFSIKIKKFIYIIIILLLFLLFFGSKDFIKFEVRDLLILDKKLFSTYCLGVIFGVFKKSVLLLSMLGNISFLVGVGEEEGVVEFIFKFEYNSFLICF